MTREEYLAQFYCKQKGIDIFPLGNKEGTYHIIIEDYRDMSLKFSPRTYQKKELESKIHELEVYYYRQNVVS